MRNGKLVGVLVALAAVLVISLSAAPAMASSCGGCSESKKKASASNPHAESWQGQRINSAHLSAALKAIDAATEAINSDNKKTALAELAKARKLVASACAAMIKGDEPKFANVRCPIMGGLIDPAKLSSKLTRAYKGQKVAFCCAGCPKAWDKLADAEKQTKLAKATAGKDHHQKHQKTKQKDSHKGHKH